MVSGADRLVVWELEAVSKLPWDPSLWLLSWATNLRVEYYFMFRVAQPHAHTLTSTYTHSYHHKYFPLPHIILACEFSVCVYECEGVCVCVCERVCVCDTPSNSMFMHVHTCTMYVWNWFAWLLCVSHRKLTQIWITYPVHMHCCLPVYILAPCTLEYSEQSCNTSTQVLVQMHSQ